MEKNQSVENLNDENSRNEDVNNANLNKIESQKNQLRNDKFLEVNPYRKLKYFFSFCL